VLAESAQIETGAQWRFRFSPETGQPETAETKDPAKTGIVLASKYRSALPHVRLLASDKLSLLAGPLLFGNVRGERLQWLSTTTSVPLPPPPPIKVGIRML